jgi:hypothetical protein
MAFAGTKGQHRADAASFTRETRRVAKLARYAARSGNCRDALHYFGYAAYLAGQAVGNKKWLGGKRRGAITRASRLGGRIFGLQQAVFKACRIR